jgi:hypothetical protein
VCKNGSSVEMRVIQRGSTYSNDHHSILRRRCLSLVVVSLSLSIATSFRNHVRRNALLLRSLYEGRWEFEE